MTYPDKPAPSWHCLAALLLCGCLSAVQAGDSQQCFADSPAAPGSTPAMTSASSNLGWQLGVAMLKSLSEDAPNTNVFFSPVSVTSALSLAYLGAGGRTEGQLREALGVSSKLEALRRMYQKEELLRPVNKAAMDQQKKHTRCMGKLANSLRTGNMMPGSERTDKVTEEFNRWLSNGTAGRLPGLMDPAIPQMMLANALSFNASWPIKQTPKGQSRQRAQEMFLLESNFKFGRIADLSAKVVEVPLEGPSEVKLTLTLLLPFKESALETTLNSLTVERLQQARGQLQSKKLGVQLPEFCLKAESSSSLNDNLWRQVGVEDLFRSGSANLSAFAAGGLWVDDTIHTVFLNLSGENVKMAAATVLTRRSENDPRKNAANEQSSNNIPRNGRTNGPSHSNNVYPLNRNTNGRGRNRRYAEDGPGFDVPAPSNFKLMLFNRPFAFMLCADDELLFLGVYRPPQTNKNRRRNKKGNKKTKKNKKKGNEATRKKGRKNENANDENNSNNHRSNRRNQQTWN